eukprot:6794155-Pyramimonas_sp.AAC.1
MHTRSLRGPVWDTRGLGWAKPRTKERVPSENRVGVSVRRVTRLPFLALRAACVFTVVTGVSVAPVG